MQSQEIDSTVVNWFYEAIDGTVAWHSDAKYKLLSLDLGRCAAL